MCVFNNPELVRRFMDKHKKAVTCYKVLVEEDGVLKSPYNDFTYKIGENKSNSRRTRPSTRWEPIDRGIYVFFDQDDANSLKATRKRNLKLCGDDPNSVKIVKVLCKPEDLLGIDSTVGVFSKVTLCA